MTHEREQGRDHAAADGHATEHDEPGRATRTSMLQRRAAPEPSGLIQRKARDDNGVVEGADEAVAAAASSSGSPLPSMLLRKFEGSLGADLSSVRVHTGGDSATAAEAVGAKAYTVGQSIHFGAGHYDPSSAAGEHLLAHEVAHTVQQAGGTPTTQYKLAVSSPGDALEHEADRAADAMVAGAQAMVRTASPTIQRDAKKETKPPGNAKARAEAAVRRIRASQTNLTVETGVAIASANAALGDTKQLLQSFDQAKTKIANELIAKAGEQADKKPGDVVEKAAEIAIAGVAINVGKLVEGLLEEVTECGMLAVVIGTLVEKGADAALGAVIKTKEPEETKKAPETMKLVDTTDPIEAVRRALNEIATLQGSGAQLAAAAQVAQDKLLPKAASGDAKAVSAVEATAAKCPAFDASVAAVVQSTHMLARQARAQRDAAKESAYNDLSLEMGIGGGSEHGDAKHASAMKAIGKTAVVVSAIAPVGLVKIVDGGKPGEMFEARAQAFATYGDAPADPVAVGQFRRVLAQDKGTLVLDSEADPTAAGMAYKEPTGYLADEKNSPGDDYTWANVPKTDGAGVKLGFKKKE